MEAIARKLDGRRIFTAAFQRRQIERAPRVENGVAIGAEDREGS